MSRIVNALSVILQKGVFYWFREYIYKFWGHNKIFFLVSLSLLALHSNIVLADTNLKDLQVKAKYQSLAFEQEWLRLLHYEPLGIVGNDYSSYVDDAKFFIAKNGNSNPEAELLATLSAFSLVNDLGDDHAICRFPARFNWLKQQLSFRTDQFPVPICSAYQQWLQEINAYSVSLIFASAYLNSPSSMFGHTLLRLDRQDINSQSTWLSYVINFGADLQDQQDNSLLYAYKGFSGGYPGKFAMMPFFKKIQEYSFMENRDLWEYKLNLDEQETQRLISHLWELKAINFNYYYTSENCSFRLLELLEVARPSANLTEQFPYTTIPSDIIHAISENGLIESTTYRPSQAVLLQQQINRIPKQYHWMIEGLAENIAFVNEPLFAGLDQNLQKEIVDAAYQFLRYQITANELDSGSAKIRFKLLALLSSFPLEAGLADSETIDPIAPNLGHRSKMASLALGYDQNRVYTELAYRQNYHDLLDSPAGFFSGAQINFFDLHLRLYEDGDFRLQQLELLNIMSISPRNQFFKPISWRVSTGVNYQNFDQEDKITGYFNAGAGLSYQLFEQGLNYNFVNFLLAYNDDFRDVVEPGLGVTIGQLFYSSLGTSKLEFDSQNYLDGSYLLKLGFEHNFVLDVNQAVRFSVRQEWNQRKNFNHVELSYRLYF